MSEPPRPNLPDIPAEARAPWVDALLEFIQWQHQRIAALEDEIHKLKNETRKPPPPSQMEKAAEAAVDPGVAPKKKGPQRGKAALLDIHEERAIGVEDIPSGPCFKGYRDVVVQDLLIRAHNTRHRLERHQTPSGQHVSGALPAHIRGGHWGGTLHAFIPCQHHHRHVTQPLLLEQLHSLGAGISSGQPSQLLTCGLDSFHAEKDSLLRAGLEVPAHLHTDGTGARHAGKAGCCAHIGNGLFAWFAGTESNSRINFLELLGKGVGQPCYTLNSGALEYMARQKLPKALLAQLEGFPQQRWDGAQDWESWLDRQKITGPRHRRIATEGALMGGLLQQGITTDLAVMPDDAGQFNVFGHALCWIHAERLANRLPPLNGQQQKAANWVRDAIWTTYADLKAYKQQPQPGQAEAIRAYFDEMCNTKTDYATPSQILKRLRQNRHELLRVLDRPELPLHNNLGERDIRGYVKKRKISGSTRSEDGRRCRDAFASLKKTCRKHPTRFWGHPCDRPSHAGSLPPLAGFIRAAACQE